MPSVNEQLQDSAISHSIDMTRYSNGVVRRLIALLNRSDADLFAQMNAALERLPAESFTVERLDMLLADVRRINEAAYLQLRHGLEGELKDLVAYESGYQMQLFQSTLPVQVSVASVSVEQVYSAALARPMQNRLLKEWAQGMESDKMVRIRDALRMGYVEGETIGQMVQRIRGTRARGYEDGIIQTDRRNAEAIVRTAISHTAGHTRDRFAEANASLIAATVWISTLDMRTTKEICVPRDGKKYDPVTHKPIGHDMPWGAGPGRAHWNCRSSSYFALKSWKSLGIDMEELPESFRASMDGTVPESTTYIDWIKKQSAGRQDDVLGPTRGKLLRSGGLPVDRLYDKKGKWLSLDQLREKDAAAFSRAGL